MEKRHRSWRILAVCLMLVLSGGCQDDEERHQVPDDVWDIDQDGVPQFVGTNFIELDRMARISRFRSSVGHDYSDFSESCRSMKHYFEPDAATDWSTIRVFSPVGGILTRVEDEGLGFKLEIASDLYPAFRFSIFHVTPAEPFQVNDHVTEGQILGTHFGNATYSDISVIVNDPTHQGRMVSFFQVITDSVFGQYVDRGVATREEMIITRAERDASPLTCEGDQFTSVDALESWVQLD
jgi:hypothetical protein